MNKVILTGRLTADIELRKTQLNKSVTEFNLAVDRDRKDSSGNRQSDFISVVVWEGSADFLAQYAKKGTLIAVIGRLETSKYTAKDGTNRKKDFVTAERVEIMRQPAENKQTEAYEPKRATESFTYDDIDYNGVDFY